MIHQSKPLNQRGIAHLGLILLVLVVAVIGFVAYSRVKSANNDTTTQSSATSEDQTASEDQAIDQAEQASTAADNTQEVQNVAP